MDVNSRKVLAKGKDLAGLREEQRVHDRALETARAEQAKVRATVMQKEKNIKKQEKTLDGKVCICAFFSSFDVSLIVSLAYRGPTWSLPKLKSRIQPARSTMRSRRKRRLRGARRNCGRRSINCRKN